MTKDNKPSPSSMLSGSETFSNTNKSKTPNTPRNDVIELLDDKAHADDLVFQLNGKKIVMKEAELAQLLQPIPTKSTQEKNQRQSKPANPSEQGTNIQLPGQQGLKTAKDVIAYFKSPAGEKDKALKHDQLALLVAMREAQEQQLQRKALLRQLFMANHRLLKLAKRKAETKALNAAYQRQIDKSLAYGRTAAAEQRASASDASSSYFDEALWKQIKDAHALRTQMLEDDLQEKIAEKQKLDTEIAALDVESNQIVERYNILDTHFQAVDEHYDTLLTMQTPAEQSEAIQAVLAELQNGIKQFNLNIQQHASNGEDEQAELLLNHMDGFNLQIEELRTIDDVLNSRKTFYNAEGEQTNSYKDAAHVLSNQNHLHKDKETGKIYLLKTGQNFADMNADEKAESHVNYVAAKPELTTNRVKIGEYKATEMSLFEEKKQGMIARSAAMGLEILASINKVAQSKAAEASLDSRMAASGFDLTNIPTPRPTPTPTSGANQPQAKPRISTTQSFREGLEKIRYNPTPEDINSLNNGLIFPSGQPNRAAQNEFTNTIKPHEAISTLKINNLLANLERLGVSANKPNVTSIPSQHPNKLENQKQVQKPEQNPEPSSSPSPFRTTPSPYKF